MNFVSKTNIFDFFRDVSRKTKANDIWKTLVWHYYPRPLSIPFGTLSNFYKNLQRYFLSAPKSQRIWQCLAQQVNQLQLSSWLLTRKIISLWGQYFTFTIVQFLYEKKFSTASLDRRSWAPGSGSGSAFPIWIRIRIQDRQMNADWAWTGSEFGILICLLR